MNMRGYVFDGPPMYWTLFQLVFWYMFCLHVCRMKLILCKLSALSIQDTDSCTKHARIFHVVNSYAWAWLLMRSLPILLILFLSVPMISYSQLHIVWISWSCSNLHEMKSHYPWEGLFSLSQIGLTFPLSISMNRNENGLSCESQFSSWWGPDSNENAGAFSQFT
jgi:hypothetical protein